MKADNPKFIFHKYLPEYALPIIKYNCYTGEMKFFEATAALICLAWIDANNSKHYPILKKYLMDIDNV